MGVPGVWTKDPRRGFGGSIYKIQMFRTQAQIPPQQHPLHGWL